MEKIKTNKIEKTIHVLENKQKEHQNQIEFLTTRNNKLATNLRKIFEIWDSFFKTIGVIVSIGIATLITFMTRNLYYTDGKWDFSVIVIGAIIFVGLVSLLTWLIWMLINKLLVNKIKKLDC